TVLQHGDVKLGPMSRDELQEAVERPARDMGVTLEYGLTKRILDAVGEETGSLPLLQFALTLLWKRQERGQLTHAAYNALGGVEIVHEALITHWERLRLWMATDRSFRLWQERLRSVCVQWEASNRDEGALLRGALLAEATAWKTRKGEDLSPTETTFIEASEE